MNPDNHNPKTSAAHIRAAQTYRQQGQTHCAQLRCASGDRGEWEQAAACYQQAIQLNPNAELSYYHLGNAQVQLQQWSEAIASYQRALDLNSNLPGIHKKLAHALQQRAEADKEELLSEYRQQIQQHPEQLQHYHKALQPAAYRCRVPSRLGQCPRK